MALINCPECNHEISDKAEMCPHCGCKPAEILNSTIQTVCDNKTDDKSCSMDRTPRKKTIWMILCGSAIVLILIIVLVLAGKEQNFMDRYPDLDSEYWCEIADDGSWMKISAASYNSDARYKIKSVNKDLDVSGSVYEDMMSTRAIDGKQTYENSKVSIVWRFSDSNLEVTYELKNPTKYNRKETPRGPDLLEYSLCKDMEKSLSDSISKIINGVSVRVFSFSDRIEISYTTSEYDKKSFAKMIDGAVADINSALSYYNVTSFRIDFRTDMEKINWFTWTTEDLIVGDYMDTSTMTLKTGIDLTELFKICNYTPLEHFDSNTALAGME